jgi:hypothetical protein
MDWMQFFGLLVPMMALFGFLYRELKEWCRESREKSASIRNEGRQDREVFREEIRVIREEIRSQSARSDRLYEMFIDLVKNKKEKTT